MAGWGPSVLLAASPNLVANEGLSLRSRATADNGRERRMGTAVSENSWLVSKTTEQGQRMASIGQKQLLLYT